MKEKIENLPVLIFLLVGVAFAGFNYMGSLSVVETLQTELSQLNTQLKTKQDDLVKAQTLSGEIPMMKEEIANLGQTLSRAADFIPASLSTTSMLANISRDAKTSGVRITQSRPSDIVPKNYYDEVPLEVEFEGSYTQLTLFMSKLAKQSMILHPTNMQLSTKEIVDGHTNLKMVGKITAFKYKEGKQ